MLFKDICPDNIECPDPAITTGDNVAIGIGNPSGAIVRNGNSVCVGAVNEDQWDVIGSAPPDGNYLIIRANGCCVEVVSDSVGSRSAWYFINDHVCIVATSQRAIVRLLGAFEFNSSVIPWMLTTGTLGPKGTWDSRLSRLGPNEILSLDRAHWHHRIETLTECGQVDATPEDLRRVVGDACSDIVLDPDCWALPLSGGYDSRALLILMARPNGLRTVTWGRSGSRCRPGTDAFVAKHLAKHFGVANEYFETDASEEPITRLFNRFVVAGEGGCDHISAYMDGFEVWRTLFARGITGILRGDEAFGWKHVVSETDVRVKVGIPLWKDYDNLPPASDLGIEAPQIPRELRRGHRESLPQWRDRLYRNFRVPVLLSALSDLKLPYVEISNPLLSRSIIAVASALPDSGRTDKLAFRKYVDDIGPDIPFASQVSIQDRGDIVRDPEFVALLRSTIQTTTACSLFSTELRLLVDSMLSTRTGGQNAERSAIRRKIRSIFSSGIIRALNMRRSRSADFNVIALRMAIITQMHNMLRNDGSTFPVLQSIVRERRHAGSA